MIKVIFFGLVAVLLLGCKVSDSETRIQNNDLVQSQNTVLLQDLQTLDGSQFEVTLNPEQLQIVNSILYSFRNDKEISENKKNLANYRLEIRVDKSSKEDFVVGNLLVKRDPNKIYVGGETEYGIDVVYRVSRKDFRIVQRAFQNNLE